VNSDTGWVYAIDPAYAPHGPDGAVPPEGIIGGWKIGDDGTPAGEYRPTLATAHRRLSSERAHDHIWSPARTAGRSQ